jgi:hypothetical protein
MRRLITAAVLVAAALAGTVPASADVAQSTVVSENPVDWTPHVLDGTVWAVAVVGDTVLVGGDFSEVTDHNGNEDYDRENLFAFDLNTGAVRDFAPELDGPVYALAPGAAGTVYAGGAFGSVNGEEHAGLARLRVSDGAPVAGFRGGIDTGYVGTLAVHGGWLYAGGTFTQVNGVPRTALARLNATSGAVDGSFDAKLAASGKPRVKVEDLALSPDGRRLVVVGKLTHAAGKPRAQLVMVDTAASPPRVSDWYTTVYADKCEPEFDTYLRGADFAPDGSYFVVVTTGGWNGPGWMCDSAARFEAGGTGRHNPTWVNKTGGDSLYSVAATGAAVYVGGHQRWMDNPQGQDDAGPGAVSRPGIAAINPRTGKALAWNPTRSRGAGVRALVATRQGLFVGSDTDKLGHEYHGRIGMFPLQ